MRKGEFKLEKKLVIGKHACRTIIGKQANGRAAHCLDTWRVISTDGRKRYGTMSCLHGHVQREGQRTILLNPVQKGVHKPR